MDDLNPRMVATIANLLAEADYGPLDGDEVITEADVIASTATPPQVSSQYIDAARNVMEGLADLFQPMTTVDEGGNVWRLEQPFSEDGFDGAGYDTHPPHAVTYYGRRVDGAMERPERIVPLYRLAPIEVAP